MFYSAASFYMHDFQVRDNALYCEECRISDIVKETGTPAYIYSSKTIVDHYIKIQKAFSSYPTQICYSIKANSNINIVSLLKEKGAGADIVSGGELFRAIKAGIPPKKIVFSGAGKTDEEIEYALSSNIYFFNVESIPELYRISEIAGKLKLIARISIRVNPDIDAGTHHFTTTGKKENKFGLDVNKTVEYYKLASQLPNIEVFGIDVHLGSPILNTEPYTKALGVLSEVVQKLRKNNINLKVLDLGGGLGIVYKNEKPFTAQTLAEAVIPLVKEMNLDLVLEPGRFIVGNAGILATRVTYVKSSYNKTFVIVDAGMNDLIRPPLYGGYHGIMAVEKVQRPAIKADVVGPVCESSDFFAKDRDVPQMEPGEIIAVMSAGAYGFSMSSNYNSRPRACEVLVEKDRYRIIRKRESFEDLVRDEVLLS